MAIAAGLLFVRASDDRACSGGLTRFHTRSRECDYGHATVVVAVVALGLARRVAQGYEDLGLRLLQSPHRVADDAGATPVVMLVAEAIIDASGGVALLGRGVLVVVEDLLDDGEERSENRSRTWRGLPVGRGLGLVNDRVGGAEVEVILQASLPEAQLSA